MGFLDFTLKSKKPLRKTTYSQVSDEIKEKIESPRV